MPEAPPPERAVPKPVLVALRAGTRVWRAHSERRLHSLFNPVPRDPQFLDGRFSGMTPDRFPYCYLGLDRATALLERYARTVPFIDQGPRTLKRSTLQGQMLSEYVVAQDLTMVSLCTTADLAAVFQDHWLVQVEGHDHAKTRRWAQWIRAHCPDAQGLLWPSKRDISRVTGVLFGDRCPDRPLRPTGPPTPLLGPAEGELNQLLSPYRLVIGPARARRLSPGDEPGPVRA